MVGSRYAAYILIGIYIFWGLVFLAGVVARCSLLRSRRIYSPAQAPDIQVAEEEEDPNASGRYRRTQSHRSHSSPELNAAVV